MSTPRRRRRSRKRSYTTRENDDRSEPSDASEDAEIAEPAPKRLKINVSDYRRRSERIRNKQIRTEQATPAQEDMDQDVDTNASSASNRTSSTESDSETESEDDSESEEDEDDEETDDESTESETESDESDFDHSDDSQHDDHSDHDPNAAIDIKDMNLNDEPIDSAPKPIATAPPIFSAHSLRNHRSCRVIANRNELSDSEKAFKSKACRFVNGYFKSNLQNGLRIWKEQVRKNEDHRTQMAQRRNTNMLSFGMGPCGQSLCTFPSISGFQPIIKSLH